MALAVAVPGCANLRDRDPFISDTVTISKDPKTGEISISPTVIRGNWHYGRVQVENQTGENHGFGIDELAIYQEIPRDEGRVIGISDAQDDTTYVFYCYIHDPKGEEGSEYRGELVIDYSETEGL